MVFDPSAKLSGEEAVPEATEVKEPLPTFTSETAPAALTVGVTLMPSLAFEMVYAVVPDANTGDRVPAERVSAESLASSDRVYVNKSAEVRAEVPLAFVKVMWTAPVDVVTGATA